MEVYSWVFSATVLTPAVEALSGTLSKAIVSRVWSIASVFGIAA